MNVAAAVGALTPAAVVTLTATLPLACGGEDVVIRVSESTTKTAAASPKRTVSAPLRFSPRSLTVVPPSVEPRDGWTEMILGGVGATVVVVVELEVLELDVEDVEVDDVLDDVDDVDDVDSRVDVVLDVRDVEVDVVLDVRGVEVVLDVDGMVVDVLVVLEPGVELEVVLEVEVALGIDVDVLVLDVEEDTVEGVTVMDVDGGAVGAVDEVDVDVGGMQPLLTS